MAVLPFRRHGRSRVDAIQARMEAAAQDWLRGWSSHATRCQVHGGQDGNPAHGGIWLRTADEGVTVWLPSLGLARLGCALAGVPMGDGQALAEAIGRRALNELVAALIAKPGVELVAVDEVDEAKLHPRHGVLPLRIALEALTLELHLSPSTCDALAAPVRASAIALCDRREAFAGSTLRLTAMLELGSAGLDAAVTLRPGEIIRATAIENAVVSVHADDGAELFRGVLDANDGRKALRCTRVQTH